MPKFYAVITGRDGPQIYNSWPECQEVVNGFRGAIYKSFRSYEEAEHFIVSASPSASTPPSDTITPNKKSRIGDEEKAESPVEVLFDGSSRSAVKKSGCGYVIKQDGREVHSDEFPLPYMTNNQAEYQGAIEGLKYATSHFSRRTKITLMGDSQLVINQLKGVFAVRDPKMWQLFQVVQNLVIGRLVEYEWIGREKNQTADELSKSASSRSDSESDGV